MSNKPNVLLSPAQRDLFVIGTNLETDYGTIRPYKIKEYPNIIYDLEILKMADWEIKSNLKKQTIGNVLAVSSLEDLSALPLIECIKINTFGLRKTYDDIFSKIIVDYNPKFLFKFTTQDEFDSFRMLILDYNNIDYMVWNKNEELRYYQKLEIFFNKATGKSVDFDAMFTSLMAVGMKPHDINDFTLNQFYSAFKRLQFFKAYDTSTLFKTVDSSGKVDITEWYTSTKDGKRENTDRTVDEIFNENKKFSKQ